MNTYNSFNELVCAQTTNDMFIDCFNIPTDNMSPRFNSIPSFKGYNFGVRSNEEFIGGKLESPHIHAVIGDNVVGKFWLEDTNTGHVSVAPNKTKQIPKSKRNDIIKYLEKHQEKCLEEWDAWIIEKNFQERMNSAELEKFNERQQKRR
jgi:hypothetical protein